MKKALNNRTFVILIGVVLVFGAIYLTSRRSSDASEKSSNNGRISVSEPDVKKDVGFEFAIPLQDNNQQKVSDINITIESAEIRDQIIVQGKKYTSIKGRTFLILDLKVKNEYNRSIEVKTRNYFRLSVNGNEDDWLAPDIHNDPLEVQAISTKPTRVGFAIDEGSTDFVLQVGQIEGDKQRVELDL